MTKNDLVRDIASRTGQTLVDVTTVIDHLPLAIITGLIMDGEASIHGVGKLVLKPRAARQARNPGTGELIDIPPGKKVQFRPSKHLKKFADAGVEP